MIGDFNTGTVVYCKFTTFRVSTGRPYSLAGGAVTVYKNGSATPSSAGVTLTADFNGQTGLNHVAIDTSSDPTFYAAGAIFEVVVSAGTVDGVTAVGIVVDHFTLGIVAAVLTAQGYTTALASKLTTALGTEYIGSVTSGAGTTTTFEDTAAGSTTNRWKDRVVIFTGGACVGQAKPITGYNGATHVFTTTAFTTAPGNGDPFIIV